MTLQELSFKEVHEPCSRNDRGHIHEERRLRIEELDEWRAHKPRTHDKPKLHQNEFDTSSNLLKVGDKVLLDAADHHIVTTTPNEEIPFTILSFFHSAFNVIFKRKENHCTSLEEEERSVILQGSNRENSSPSLIELFFGIIEPTYLELMMELYSTFHLQIVMTRYDDPGTVQFRLGRLIRQLSIPEFGAALGLYMEEFREENELHALSRHIHFSLSKCWYTLAPGTASYNPSCSKASVLPPSLRALYRPCLFHRPWIQHQMERHRKGVISIGPYVTRLARHFGLLNTAAQESSLTHIGQMSPQGISSMLSVRMIERR
ncbi:hypothetical protein GOBAR_AA00137 [Gossypium barbadense]|uniref:Uncharacterized protein n=1 Tax=Gossypium barbadense TaxID=3634 RepID=A0A2P5YXT4_GOSBA|nr:hypothetical protein GOBAR_AA00137 [Gossypium barbadense]